jgi:hypothetical protein
MKGDFIMAYSAELVRFVSSIPILNDGTIPTNSIDSGSTFASTLYDATYSLSVVARLTQDLIKNDKIELVSGETDSTTIVHRALNSDLSSYTPTIYLLLKSVVLESFSILYMMDNDPVNLQYVSAKDIRRVRQNVNFIADYFSTEPKYYHMIENMRDINISFGYIENQIDVIMKERGVR